MTESIIIAFLILMLLFAVFRYQAMERKWLEAEMKLSQLQAVLRNAKPSE